MSSLDIGAILKGEVFNRVKRMGVELEGAWRKLPPGIVLEHDGSVFRRERGGMGLSDENIGELPIGPIEIAAMPRNVKRYYPDLVNESCGMHIHMSFRDLLHYGWLMKEDFQDTMITHLLEWALEEKFPPNHHIWARLRGENLFCQRQYWPDAQASRKVKDHDQGRPGHRYTIVNYVGRQNTIEVRVLPMMTTSAQAIRGIQRVIDITNASLIKLATRKDKIRGRLELPDVGIYEESEEELPLSASSRRRLRGER